MSTPEENALTIRAAAEVFVPGSPHDPTPGAADVHAELFISHYLDFLIPGLATGLPDLLNELSAATFDGRTFVDLSPDERLTILDQLSTHDVEQLRELPLVLGLLSIASVYGEWTGQDAEGALTRRPLGWQLTGFDGPSRGRRKLLRPPEH
ncbi:MAG: gluconate 2-dehydrogenase subunit 3 family protein [Actinobacteria bacterium]|nr:MAG: gluconate 2-dehydrogenase subunit 3 family protein [Actinomycetota bacterium]